MENSNVSFATHFVDGPFAEVTGDSPFPYFVQFIDGATGEVVHQGTIPSNHWIRASRKWYTDWNVRVYKENDIILDKNMNLKGKKVFISIESKSLGDTIAWFPFVEEFRKKHNCQVVVSTFWNKLFKNEYFIYNNIKELL